MEPGIIWSLWSSIWSGLHINGSDFIFLISLAVFCFFLLRLAYNLYLHPLAAYPGPVAWRMSRIPYLRAVWSGRLHVTLARLHKKYGVAMRIAPNEISFADPEAWNDIFSNRGNPAFPKSAVWHGAQSGRTPGITNALDTKTHSRFRRALDPVFTDRALSSQETTLQQHVNRLISILEAEVEKGVEAGAQVNIADWYTYTLFDITGDLAFGETFDCLRSDKFRNWPSLISGMLKTYTMTAMLRHYSLVNKVLEHILIPSQAQLRAMKHWEMAINRIDKRLNTETDRADFVSFFETTERQTNKEGVTVDEIKATSSTFIIAGAETASTVLTGITYHLIRTNPGALARLTKEVRDYFPRNSDITLDALKSLAYLNAVIQEALRMCIPVPNGDARITPAVRGKVAGHWIPGNTFVSVHPFTMAMSPERFHEHDMFRPERWLLEARTDSSSPYFSDQRHSIETFGVGAMSCIGKRLAWAEMRLMLAKMVWKFELEKEDSGAGNLDWDNQLAYGLLVREPFEIRLKPRVG
ncbi:cytochrome P450 [Pyrenochaeta sp. MPI-SDFR-AT-0127]|nr:cytochrome P450 [Pyrenochaeta sp. MPI-SDFR-AT-0127]